MIDPKRILHFWFRHEAHWFAKDPKFDEQVLNEFVDVFEFAMAGGLDHWALEAENLLALIIVLDQFPRNMFRQTPKAFSGDEKAILFTKLGVDKGLDQKLDMHTYLQFFYMPLMHSESLADQELSVELYGQLKDELTLKFAKAHRDIIATFGRFPHRNRILGRVSTPEELAFLEKPGSSF